MVTSSVVRSASGSYAGSVASSRSSASRRARADNEKHDGTGEDLLDRHSSLEDGIFGVLYTLRKESKEARVRISWVFLKIFLDALQLFTTIIAPERQGWSIEPNKWPWTIVSALTFNWLGKLSYGWYLALLYVMVVLLGTNVALCIWVAWCFKEQKFTVVWPIKVLRLYSSVFFQALDVAALNLLELGITCRYNGYYDSKMIFDLFPQYSCSSTPHVMHAVVSGLSLAFFVVVALLSNMAEVEVDLLSKRPFALGHSGPVVMAFGFKVLITLVRVFIGWRRVQACLYLSFSLAFAWQFLRWSPYLVRWVNYLRSGISVAVVWCSVTLMLLVFHPGVSNIKQWADIMTSVMLSGLAPAFIVGALMSWFFIRRMTDVTISELKNAKLGAPLKDICTRIDDPQDVEIVARCCRVWKDKYTVDPMATEKARQVIQAGVAMFPNSAYMILLQANFMISVMGVSQSGSRRIQDARKLGPGPMSRFVMFVRQQEASQQAAGSYANGGASMDLLGYVEYQRKQRMVVRLHREALQAMCNFWKLLEASRVSFTQLSKALGRIETSVSQAQTAYRVILENYGSNPKLVRLYGKFLLTIKNDPWKASEYFSEADRLQETQNGDGGRGPLLPDGTPLGRMDEIATAVFVISSNGDIQMANRHAHTLFGYKRGTLEGNPMAALLAPHYSRWLSDQLAYLAGCSSSDLVVTTVVDPEQPQQQQQGACTNTFNEMVVGMHSDRLAFPVKLALRRASGVGEDSTFIAMMEVVPPVKGVASLWVAHNGTIVACDPQFVLTFGWKSHEVNGVMLPTIMSFQGRPSNARAQPEVVNQICDGSQQQRQQQQRDTASGLVTGQGATSAMMKTQENQYILSPSEVIHKLLSFARSGVNNTAATIHNSSLPCLVAHKYDTLPVRCAASIFEPGALDRSVYEVRIELADTASVSQQEMLVVNRRGAILHSSAEIMLSLISSSAGVAKGVGSQQQPIGALLRRQHRDGSAAYLGGGGIISPAGAAAGMGPAVGTLPPGLVSVEHMASFTLCDFLPSPWKEMHYKYLRGTTAITPASRNPWTCRKEGPMGPTLELRTASGQPLFMRVAVTTVDMVGELHHVIRMTGSSQDAALGERRLRLQISQDGFIISVDDSSAAGRALGLNCCQLKGRALWDIINWSHHVESGSLPAMGPLMFATLVKRELFEPGISWRVQVSAPKRTKTAGGGSGHMSDIMALARTSVSKAAILRVHIELPSDIDDTTPAGSEVEPTISVELWLQNSVSGVLEVDGIGRIRAVLEERMRPAGLLFGVSTQSLMGCLLGEFVAMPQGRMRPADLLLNSLKKSSLKTTTVESSVKVGPVHVLQAAHADGLPNTLDVQVVSKNGSSQNTYIILRPHIVPMLPSASAVGVLSSAPRRPTLGSTNTKFMPSPATAFMLPAASSDGAATQTKPETKTQAATADPSSIGVGGCVVGVSTPPEYQPLQRRAVGNTSSTVLPAAGSSSAPSAGAPPMAGRSSPLEDPLCLLHPPPPPPDGLLGGGLADGLPVPTVMVSTANKLAAQPAVARGKLADMVKSAVVTGSDRTAASGSGGGGYRCGRRQTSSITDCNNKTTEPLAAVATVCFGGVDRDLQESTMQQDGEVLVGVPSLLPAVAAATTAAATDMDVESANGEHDGDDDDTGANMVRGPKNRDKDRISTWVASQGAYYQNSAVTDDGGKSDEGGQLLYSPGDVPNTAQPLGPSVDLKAFLGDGSGGGGGGGGGGDDDDDDDDPSSANPNPKDVHGVMEPVEGWVWQGERSNNNNSYPAEEDTASEGGQSALSAQSGDGGADYKRGKRFRKLMKLMDSSQTQQVQQRYKRHSLAIVALLAAVHIVCFALTIHAIRTKRDSMLQLGRSGQAQRYMHQIMADVRTLDMISKNRTHPKLFNATDDDVKFFINRTARAADEIQARFRDILNSHHTSSANVRDLLFYTTRRVWDGNDDQGNDTYRNITIWDFNTRFYTMAKEVEQHGEAWVKAGVNIAEETAGGQFLIKSGPDMWRASRQVLDALLYVAVEDAQSVDSLQIVFLCVEGAAITSVAACYLAYLLKAVSAQRYKLYSTFMHIPLGLTKALASQITTLTVDEEDDDDSDDDKGSLPDEQEGDAAGDSTATDGAVNSKQKRRAMLITSVPDTTAAAVASAAVTSIRNGRAASSSPTTNFGGAVMTSNALGRDTLITSPKSKDSMGLEGLHSRRNSRSFKSRSSQQQQSPLLPRSLSEARDKPAAVRGGGAFRRFAWDVRGMFSRLGSRVAPLSTMLSSTSPSSPAASDGGGLLQARRQLKYDSHETRMLLMPFIIWSALVFAIYIFAVSKMSGIVEVLAVHSVVNFIAARTYRAVFFCQELVAVSDSSKLPAARAAVAGVWKVVRDAWYTLQLGADAYKAIGSETERFPLVKSGLSSSSPHLSHIFYGSDQCHRVPESLPCPGREYRFYHVIHAGLDSIMHQFMMHVDAMASSKSPNTVGLDDENFDFIYNVGTKDLMDGTVEIQEAHLNIIMSLFTNLMVLHVILLILFWIIFASFLLLLLNPLLKRISRERRRVAELMSQLPLELDVERLVARALGAPVGSSGATIAPASAGIVSEINRPIGNGGAGGAIHGSSPHGGGGENTVINEGFSNGQEAVTKWKTIIRAASSQLVKGQSGSLHTRRGP